MGLGILEDNKLPHVPGTVLLDELAGHTEAQTANLKHGTGKDAHIILAPQPSEDPNDPLNWSAFQKEFVLIILCFGSIVNAATQVKISRQLGNFIFRLTTPGTLNLGGLCNTCHRVQ